jgi:UDP-hydrolysing UDP-N-acetyl-D-glucosamine 2-epimerase
VSTRKVCAVVLTRANYARIAYTLRAVRSHPGLGLQLVVGGSALLYKYGSAVDVVVKDGFQPDATLYSVIDGGTPATMAKSTGLLTIELATVLQQLRPDVVLTIADNFATLATAVASTYMNIPLAHTQGGEVTGSIDESVRHAVTKLAHVHFPATERAREWVIRMGEDPATVHMVGCPSIDIAAAIDRRLTDGLLDGVTGTGPRVALDQPYLVVVEHPVTTEYGRGFDQIQETLEAVHGLGCPAVWFWPNVDAGSDDVSKGLRMFRERHPSAPVCFVRNLPVEAYLRLISNSACLVGNSSVGVREASFLGVPAVNIGTRQQHRERGENVSDVDHERSAIARAISSQISHGPYERSCLYGDGHASQRIADILDTQEFAIQKTLSYVHESWDADGKYVADPSFGAGATVATTVRRS